MYALQDFRWEWDADDNVTVYGRVERQNPETGLWDVVADFTQRGIWWPEFWALLTRDEQNDFLGQWAGAIMLRAAGVEG